MTTKELSEICNVSQQSIQKWCIKNNIPKTTVKNNTSYILDDDTVNRILEYYSKKSTDQPTNKQTNQPTNNGTNRQTESDKNVDILIKAPTTNQSTDIEFLQSELEKIRNDKEQQIIQMQSHIETLKLEIETIQKDKQSEIDSLKSEKKEQREIMQAHIDSLQKQLETERLEKQTLLAKYLVMNEEQEEKQEEVKATVVEPEPVKAEQEPTEQEEKSQKKQGFFSRLFKRK